MKPKKISIRTSWGLLAASGVAIYLAVMLIQIVKRNYDLQHQVADLKSQIDSLQNDKADLNYKLSYYKTDSFQEKEARAKLGLQAPGESVIILPKTPAPAASTPATKTALPKSNWQQWQDFLFGK